MVDNLVDALRGAGHRAEAVSVPTAWDRDRLYDAAMAWRMIPLDAEMVIPVNFPAYFARHPNKVPWLAHQHRAAYDGLGQPWSDFGLDPASIDDHRQLLDWDIRALAERAHAVGALVAVDNTFATPIFQRPLELGADMVVHSTTKYINGHSDVVGGIVITASPELDARLRFIQNSIGAVPGIWDCWLTLRGVKTLAVRMDRHQANARALVAWLKSEPRVSRVWYPMDESHPQHEIAKGQMHGFGGMISFEIDADLATAERFCAATKVITLAESLGGVESLIELPAAMTHASIPAEVRRQIGIADGLVRISVGIEHVDDLIADLRQALDQAFSDSK